jgi:asparagine synthase (glutamine-hydrolysing)
MCGIAAIFAYDRDAPGVNEAELLSIRDCMTARGPDGAGEWCGAHRRIGLAHRRLSIIDLSPAGAQPMLLADRELAIVFNGEIYNYRELRCALEKRGRVFKSASDTEVLLHLYAERGEAMVHELRGMFAFAIWDGAKRGLFLARDPLGIKPLYVADDGKTLRVASQVKALLAGGKIDTTPEPAGHTGFFLWGHVPEPYTLYRGIRSLPAGVTMWIDANGTKRQWTYCSVKQVLANAEREHCRLAAPRSALLRSALEDSVRRHCVADVPVGVFLSSGMDSSTLTGLAAEQGGRLCTITLGFQEFKGSQDDETPLAECVATHYGTQHQTIWVSRNDFSAHLDRFFTSMDQPSTDGVNTYFVSLVAARSSLKVALSGLGGDELFAGYPSFAQVPRMAGGLRFLPPGNSLGKAFRVFSSAILKHFTSPKYAGLLEYGGSYGGAYLLRRGMFMPWELPEVLDVEIARQGWEELQPVVRLEETLNGLRSPRARVICLELCRYMRNQRKRPIGPFLTGRVRWRGV